MCKTRGSGEEGMTMREILERKDQSVCILIVGQDIDGSLL